MLCFSIENMVPGTQKLIKNRCKIDAKTMLETRGAKTAGKVEPKGSRREPKGAGGSREGAEGHQKGAEGAPKAAKGEPKTSPGAPSGFFRFTRVFTDPTRASPGRHWGVTRASPHAGRHPQSGVTPSRASLPAGRHYHRATGV